MKIQKKIMEKSTTTGDIKSLSPQDLYQDALFMNNWVKGAKKCTDLMKCAKLCDARDIPLLPNSEQKTR